MSDQANEIRHKQDGWHVYSEKGKHLGGPYKDEMQAKHRLAQVEYFKKLENQAKRRK